MFLTVSPIAVDRYSQRFVKLLAFLSFAGCAWVALRYCTQALYDLHSFRQTQTALTSMWFLKDGFRLDYETPIGGYPWSIPFEFPIYQALVALIMKSTGMPLEAAGRLLAFAFMAGCVFPARSVVRKLNLSDTVTWIFAALLFSCPIYVYWGRTFMIETAALFFALASLPFYLDMLAGRGARSAALFGTFMALALLQKVTTPLPLFVLLAVVYAVQRVHARRSWLTLLSARNVLDVFLGFVVPLVLAVAWILYSDHVRSLNPMGDQLTHDILPKWNWGTFEQRHSSDLWIGVVWQRIVMQNLGGWHGLVVFVFAFAFLQRSPSAAKWGVALCFIAGLLPLLFFANLHIVHNYYQTANVVFFLFALAIAIGAFREMGGMGEFVAAVAVTAVVACNCLAFAKDYLPAAATQYDVLNSRDVEVGRILQREVDESHSVVAYGYDWSSVPAYGSQRKSFAVAPWFNRYAEAVEHPERFVMDPPLGAVVGCLADEDPNLSPMLNAGFIKSWSFGFSRGCYIGLPDRTPPLPKTIGNNSACVGNLDFAGSLLDPKTKAPLGHVLHLWGWNAASNVSTGVNQQVYIALSNDSGVAAVHRGLRVVRTDVANFFHNAAMADSGFSLIFDAAKLDGKYRVEVIREIDGNWERCQWKAELDIH